MTSHTKNILAAIALICTLNSGPLFSQFENRKSNIFLIGIGLGQQSYLEEFLDYTRNEYIKIDKYCSPSLLIDIQNIRTIPVRSNFQFGYGFGVGIIKQSFNYFDFFGSSFWGLDIARSEIEYSFLSALVEFSYLKQTNKKIFFSPTIKLSASAPIFFKEEIRYISVNYYNMANADSQINPLVPQLTFGFKIYKHLGSKYSLIVFPALTTTGKYYKEPLGNLALPISLSFNIGLSSKL